METNDKTSHIADDIRQRVLAVDPNQGRCLVQNASSDDIEYCYVFPRHFKYNEELMRNIEWNWKMQKGTLNLDTRYNVFPAERTIRELYDSEKFILVPDDAIIQEYAEAILSRQDYPNYNDDKFEYRLIPIADMESITIARQTDSNTTTFTTYTYPFDTLPKLVSHIRPNFVALAAGYMTKKLNVTSIDDLWERWPILQLCARLHTFWTRTYPSPRIAYLDNTYFPEYFSSETEKDMCNDDSESLKTVKGRGHMRWLPDLPLPDGSCRSYSVPSESTYYSEDDSEMYSESESQASSTGSYMRRSHTPPGRCRPAAKRRRVEDPIFLLEDSSSRMWNNETIAEWVEGVDISCVVPEDVVEDVCLDSE